VDGVLVDELLDLATRLAAQAAALLVDGLARDRTEISTKSTRTDMVTEIDHASERLIVDGIRRARPDDGILGEEGTTIAGTSGVRWIVDPLDGTTNYLYRHAGFAVSIAVELDGEVDGGTVVGVVNDPLHGDEFRAVRDRGAERNRRPVSVPATPPPLHEALVATGFGYDAERRRRQAQVLTGVLPAIRDIRRVGAASVDLCSVACGRVDAYFERGLGPWDLAAGALIAREAGATVAGLHGEPPSEGFVLAAPPALFEQLGALLVANSADLA
jgi:myo-inositol-1(or 4)-monophosphatase